MSTQVYGDRIRSARILRNVKAVDLARALHWPPSRQTLAEQSETLNLDEPAVSILADHLRFPPAFFTTRPGMTLAPRDLLFRAPKGITKRETNYLAEFARVAGDVVAWLGSYHRLPPVTLPSLPSGTPVAEAARQAREVMGLPADQPIANLTFRLERAGVPVIARSPAWDGLPEKHVGYSTRVGNHREQPITILRAQDSWERTRWTIGHETGHHLLHGGDLPPDAEDQANRFASELLAPAAIIRDELPKLVTLASLTDLKLRWGISVGALVFHLSWNKLINDERTDTLRKQLHKRINPETGRTWGRDEPGADARKPERPTLITTWMQRCLGGASPNLVSTLSGVWPPDIIAMMTGMAGSASSISKATGAWSGPVFGGSAASTSRATGNWCELPDDSNAGVIDLEARRRRA
jgi:Zn-dependent peptidase ImmA (M78 family)